MRSSSIVFSASVAADSAVVVMLGVLWFWGAATVGAAVLWCCAPWRRGRGRAAGLVAAGGGAGRFARVRVGGAGGGLGFLGGDGCAHRLGPVAVLDGVQALVLGLGARGDRVDAQLPRG